MPWMPRGSYAGNSWPLTVMDSSGWPYFSHSRLEPRPKSLPKPSPVATWSAHHANASAEPNFNSMPPVSFVVIAPISNNSMAAATVAPNEIGSMPSSLHTKLA